MAETSINIPNGLVAVTTYGSIQAETVDCLSNMRSAMEKQGLHNIQWSTVPGGLVEKARNDACRRALTAGAGWLCFIDGDMTFAPDALIKLLQYAYGDNPAADVVGAWCPLRGELALPTIDTGTGTWESHYPGSGPMEVMRTGGAFLLIKRHVLERMPDPWFRMRVPMRPVDAMGEVDNFANIKFDGQNPFRGLDGAPWERLEQCAMQDPSANGQWVPAEVGEDSGFCDRAKRMGFRLFVQTDVSCGHVDKKILTWADHKKAMDDMKKQHRWCVGVTG